MTRPCRDVGRAATVPLRGGASAALAALALVATLGACAPTASVPTPSGTTAVSSAAGATPTATVTTGATVADPEVVLKAQADAARALVGTLIADVPATDWTPSADGDDSCGTAADGRWPRQWFTGRRSYAVADPQQQGDRIASGLTAQGWSARTAPAASGQVIRRLQRGGVLVTITSAVSPAVLDVQVASPCVQADGTLDTRPIS